MLVLKRIPVCATYSYQVSAEAIDATVNLDGVKRSNYDPDEMMEEQRERGMRKRLNNHFKDFASKVTEESKQNPLVRRFRRNYRVAYKGRDLRVIRCLSNAFEGLDVSRVR